MLSFLPHRGVLGTGVPIVTAMFILLAVWMPDLLGAIEPYLVLGLMLLFGLPHGATDHGLFSVLNRSGDGDRSAGKVKAEFYVLYAAVLAAYGVVWFFFPVVAFGIFIVLSIYHFGQSNWTDLTYRHEWIGRCHYLVWGAGVLLTPVLLYAPQSADIVSHMTGGPFWVPSQAFSVNAIIGLAVLNVLLPLWLYARGTVGGRRLLYELGAYGLLMGMFLTNSLLLGFTVYFVFWHSLGSARDQIAFFRGRLSGRQRRELQLEIGATVIGAVIFCAVVWFGAGPAAALSKEIIGGVFVFISLLTLPHMLLVDQLYHSRRGVHRHAPHTSHQFQQNGL